MSWTHPESTLRKERISDALAIQLPSSSQTLYGPVEEKTVVIPYSDGAGLNKLLGSAQILSQEYLAEGTKLTYRMRGSRR